MIPEHVSWTNWKGITATQPKLDHGSILKCQCTFFHRNAVSTFDEKKADYGIVQEYAFFCFTESLTKKIWGASANNREEYRKMLFFSNKDTIVTLGCTYRQITRGVVSETDTDWFETSKKNKACVQMWCSVKRTRLLPCCWPTPSISAATKFYIFVIYSRWKFCWSAFGWVFSLQMQESLSFFYNDFVFWNGQW